MLNYFSHSFPTIFFWCTIYSFSIILVYKRFNFWYNLSKCPGAHQILHRGLKLNSKNLMGKYKKKLNSPGLVEFPPGSLAKLSRCLTRSIPLLIMFKKYRYSIKCNVTLTKIQSVREASHHLIFPRQQPNVLVTCLCLCVTIFMLLLWPNSKL